MMRGVVFFILIAGPAVAGSFTPPDGCTTFLTVQSKGCRVSNYYICADDSDGDKWRVDFDQEGIFFLGRTNDEGEWLESYDTELGMTQMLQDRADPASFRELLSQRRDDYRFNLSMDGAESIEVEGYDSLTGKNVVIDGEPLQQAEFEYLERGPDGSLLRRSYGNEFISAKWRLFFVGPSQWDDATGLFSMDGSPLKFSEAGEAGFAMIQPIFDCDAVMSSLSFSRISREVQSHDNL